MVTDPKPLTASELKEGAERCAVASNERVVRYVPEPATPAPDVVAGLKKLADSWTERAVAMRLEGEIRAAQANEELADDLYAFAEGLVHESASRPAVEANDCPNKVCHQYLIVGARCHCGFPGAAVEADGGGWIAARLVVRWFAEQMEAALLLNDNKGGWHEDGPRDLALRAGEEAEELIEQIDIADGHEDANAAAEWVIQEAADTANMAMMAADHFREGGPCVDQGKAPLPTKPPEEK